MSAMRADRAKDAESETECGEAGWRRRVRCIVSSVARSACRFTAVGIGVGKAEVGRLIRPNPAPELLLR